MSEQSFVSKANLPGIIRRPTALQTPFTCFGNPKGCCRWQLVDIKPCHLIRTFLFDRKKSWLQGTTRQLWTIWMRRSAITGKWISFLKESCSFCVLHWFGLVNKISVCRLVFREVLRAFQGWFEDSIKSLGKATRRQGGGSIDEFLAFYGYISISIWLFFQIW